MQTSAYWYDGKTSDRIAVNISLEDSGLIWFTYQGVDYRFNLSESKVAPRIGSSPFFIDLIDGSRLEIPSSKEVIDVITIDTPHRLIHALESNLRYIFLSVVISVGILALTFVYGIPSAAKYIANALPADIEKHMGSDTLDLLDKTMLSPSELTASRQKELLSYFESTIDQFDRSEDFNIQFRSSKQMGPNAFALPSGTIVFTDEIVKLADDDRELVAVLAHEIGHVKGRHILRHVLQDSVFGLMVVILTGDLSSVSAMVVSMPVILAQLKHSRQFETESDEYAKQFLKRRDIDPVFLAELFKKLQDLNGEGEIGNFLSSHPLTSERIKKATD